MFLASMIHQNGASNNPPMPAPIQPSRDSLQTAGSVSVCCLTPNWVTRMGFLLSVPHVSPLELPKWRMGPTLQGLPSVGLDGALMRPFFSSVRRPPLTCDNSKQPRRVKSQFEQERGVQEAELARLDRKDAENRRERSKQRVLLAAVLLKLS